MIRDSGRPLFDMVIVWKLDRFSRNRYDSARYKTQLKRNGVKVVSATEVISDGAEGIILESVLEWFAEYYSADLHRQYRRSDHRSRHGHFSGMVKTDRAVHAGRHFWVCNRHLAGHPDRLPAGRIKPGAVPENQPEPQ